MIRITSRDYEKSLDKHALRRNTYAQQLFNFAINQWQDRKA